MATTVPNAARLARIVMTISIFRMLVMKFMISTFGADYIWKLIIWRITRTPIVIQIPEPIKSMLPVLVWKRAFK